MALDRRLHVFRPDLADAALRGQVEADRFTSATPARIGVPVAALRPRADPAAGIDTELLSGEAVRVFDRMSGWAWVQAVSDGYVGYLPEEALTETEPAPTHRVIAQRSFVYPDAELRLPPVHALSMASLVAVCGEEERRGTRYLMLDGGGAMIASHCSPLGAGAGDDALEVAARFINVPYLWGGRSGFGIDCSGLVQLSLSMVGKAMPRDTDMQQAAPAIELQRGDLARGDLVFWKGHVGFMEDRDTLLHANGHTMTVARENLDEAIGRIGILYGLPTAYRRPVF